jgi:hypothetical protein
VRDAVPAREHRDIQEPRRSQHQSGKSISHQLAWRPERIGPRFDWLDHDRIRIRDGRLAGAELGIATQVFSGTATCSLHLAGRGVGKVILEREPGRSVTLWELGVAPSQRGTGFASILTWVAFRELLAVEESAEFRIRMVRTLRVSGHEPDRPDAVEAGSGVQNIGMCVIANRLGFTSDLDVEAALRPDNVVRRSVLEAGNGMPPALEVVLKTDPLVLICLVLDPESSLPVRNRGIYLQLANDATMLAEWLQSGSAVVTNGNFSLRASGVNRFINRIAVDEEEAARFRGVVRAV